MTRVAFVIGDYPPEERRKREEVALSYSTADVEIGIVSVKATPYIHGLSPAEVQLAAGPFVEAYLDAERQGYDAAVPLGTLDLGVDAGRSVVDIPIVGPFEAMLHIGSLLGERLGVIVYSDHHIPHGIPQRDPLRHARQDRGLGQLRCRPPRYRRQQAAPDGHLPRERARVDRRASRRRDPADGHHPMSGQHEFGLGRRAARRSRGRRDPCAASPRWACSPGSMLPARSWCTG